MLKRIRQGVAAKVLYRYPFLSSRATTILWGRLVTCGRLGAPSGPGLLALRTMPQQRFQRLRNAAMWGRLAGVSWVPVQRDCAFRARSARARKSAMFLSLAAWRALPPGGSVPAIIVNRHIDAAVNEELRCFVVRVDGALMQDACRFVRAPVRIDVGSMFQKKVRNLKLPIHTCPCERDVQDVLGVRRYPMKIPEPGRIVDGVMLTEAPQPRTTGLIKPILDSREVPCAGRVGQIVGQRPNLGQ